MTKDQIIDRLLHKQLITPEEAEILRTKEIEYVPVSPYVPMEPEQQFQEIFRPTKPQKNPYDVEFQRTQNHIKNCPCNPENGGNGVCNCTIGTMPIIC